VKKLSLAVLPRLVISDTARALIARDQRLGDITMRRYGNAHLLAAFLTEIFLTNGTWAQTKNLEAIATLKFYPAAQGNSFAVGTAPSSVFSTAAISGWQTPRSVRSSNSEPATGPSWGPSPLRTSQLPWHLMEPTSGWRIRTSTASPRYAPAMGRTSVHFKSDLVRVEVWLLMSEHVGFEFLCQHDHQAAR
jgi:hypothetical protein